jgi:hypothetical protein
VVDDVEDNREVLRFESVCDGMARHLHVDSRKSADWPAKSMWA